MDDPRNTDNAWIETTVKHVHDKTGSLANFSPTVVNNSSISEVSWAVVHKHLKLFAQHLDVLRMIAQPDAFNAYW